MTRLVLEETTRSVSVFFPPSTSPAEYRGVPIGQDYDGGVFHFDPFFIYEDALVTNPNIVVVGEIGRGKSALVKTLLYRESLLGRDFFVIDPKGEYQRLARATGARFVRLSRQSPIGLCPFATSPAGKYLWVDPFMAIGCSIGLLPTWPLTAFVIGTTTPQLYNRGGFPLGDTFLPDSA